MSDSKDFYSIRQTARACGIGRTTLQRLTDSGLIKPAVIGENRYHYYDSKSIYDINTIQLLSECGFTRKQLSSLDLSDDVMASFASELQDKINILTFAMENLKAASSHDIKDLFRTTVIPELKCYMIRGSKLHTFFSMSSFVEKVLSEMVNKGLTTNKYYPPFVILDWEEFLSRQLDSDYNCAVCIPLSGKATGPNVVSFPQINALSVTYKYEAGSSRKFYSLLKDELRKRDLKPTGNPRVEALFNPFISEERSAENISLRLSIPI